MAVVWRNVHVERPSRSLSGGHSSGGPLAWDSAPIAPAIAANVASSEDDPDELDFCAFVGFQRRNAVHTLQGFPSGPRTYLEGALCDA